MTLPGTYLRLGRSLPLLMALLLGSAACDSGDSQDDAIGERTRKACRDLLGTAGEKWVKESSGRKTGLKDVTDFKSAKAQFYANARAWEPKSKENSVYSLTEVCRVVSLERERERERLSGMLSISYSASIFPFDSPFGDDDGSHGEKLVRVNSDVKLVVREDDKGLGGVGVRYAVYVQCRVPGAAEGQQTQVPLEGVMTDTLTRNTSMEEHLRYLLHSAGVAAKEFGCQNHPVVPEKLPS